MSQPYQCCGGSAYDVNTWIPCRKWGFVKQKIDHADDVSLIYYYCHKHRWNGSRVLQQWEWDYSCGKYLPNKSGSE